MVPDRARDRSRWWAALAALLMGLVLAAGLLLGGEALARVGGGESYRGGGGSSSGGSSGVDGDLVAMLIWLCLEHPLVGLPVTLIVIGVFIFKQRQARQHGQHYASGELRARGQPSQQPRPDYPRLLNDRNFSLPLFLDFVQLVYVRAQELRPAPDLSALQPYLSSQALETLQSKNHELQVVKNIIIGASRITSVHSARGWNTLRVDLESNITEVHGSSQKIQHLLVNEQWFFRRRANVLSPGPERMRTLGCASCGSTLEPTPQGLCPNCEAVRTGGQVQWEVTQILIVSRTDLGPPSLTLSEGGFESGTHQPTIFAPDLVIQRRAFNARHPEHDWSVFEQRVQHIFLTLQDAWSTQRWDRARPYESDSLFQTHRFWMTRFERFGLINHLADVLVTRVEIARIEQDAFFEMITVRIFASMRDWTERRADQSVVAGNCEYARVFSEYWTFLRATGSSRDSPSDPKTNCCPSCAAPLDKVSMAGVCRYCETKITSGDFDWVVSRIEQDEAYVG